MAIDTRQKRQSVVSIGKPWRGALVDANGDISDLDRQVIARLYYGFAISGSVVFNETGGVDITLLGSGDAYIQSYSAILITRGDYDIIARTTDELVTISHDTLAAKEK